MNEFNKEFETEQSLTDSTEKTEDLTDSVEQDAAPELTPQDIIVREAQAENNASEDLNFLPVYEVGAEAINPTDEVKDEKASEKAAVLEKTRDEKVSSTGIKVFAVILALVLVVSICLTAGYIAGRDYDFFSKKTQASIELAPKPKAADALNDAQIYEKVSNSIVSVTVYNKKLSSRIVATGIVYNKDGYIIINDHIYSKIQSPQFLVTDKDGTEYKAEYIGGDIKSDIAVLKINAGGGLVPAVFGDSSLVSDGEQVSAVGYTSTSPLTALISSGIVSADLIRLNNSSAYSQKYIQTDISAATIGSGGALTNVYGQVIGMTVRRLHNDNDRGTATTISTIAIPTATISEVAKSLITDGKIVGRARLGINYNFVDSIYSELNRCPVGVYIVSIASDSNLSNTDVKEGDIITHINDTKIVNSEIVLDIIEGCRAGDVVNLTIYNKDSAATRNYSVKLAEDTGSSSYTDLPVDDSGSDYEQSEDGKYKKDFDFPLGD